MVKFAVRVFSLLAVPAAGVASGDDAPKGHCGMNAYLYNLQHPNSDDSEEKQASKQKYNEKRSECVKIITAHRDLFGWTSAMWTRRDEKFCAGRFKVTEDQCQGTEELKGCCVWYPLEEEGETSATELWKKYRDAPAVDPPAPVVDTPVEPAPAPASEVDNDKAAKEAAKEAAAQAAKKAADKTAALKEKENKAAQNQATNHGKKSSGAKPGLCGTPWRKLCWIIGGVCFLGLIVLAGCYMCRGDSEEEPNEESADESEIMAE